MAGKKTHKKFNLPINKEKVKPILIKSLLCALGVFFLLCIIGLIVPVGSDKVVDNEISVNELKMLTNVNTNYKLYPGKDFAHGYGRIVSGYDVKVYNWEEDADSISFTLNDVEKGEYQIAIDYLSLQTTVTEISLNVLVNGVKEDRLNNIELQSAWTDSTNVPVYDIYNNQVSAVQETCNIWRTSYLYDQRYYDSEPVVVKLNDGENTIEIEKNSGALYVGIIYVVEKQEYTNYVNPLDATAHKNLITIEAEQPMFKSSADIRKSSIQDTNVTPYSTRKNMLNVITGDSFNESGDSITYAFKVETAGYYNISFKYQINQTNTSVYSKIFVDNQILSSELNRYEFDNSKSGFKNETLANSNNEDMLFYFDEGIHTITLQLDASQQSEIYYRMSAIIEEINDLYLQILKLTGGNVDKNKQWKLKDYIPNIDTTIDNWVAELEYLMKLTNEVSKSNPEEQNRLYQNIKNAYDKLLTFTGGPEDNPNYNKIPSKLTVLCEGSASISNMLSNSLHTTTFSPLTLDKIYVHGSEAKLPRAKSNVFMDFFGTVQRVVFAGVEEDEEEVLEVWVNRSTYYVSLMQQYADAYFTPKYGIKVRLSLLPDESKLTYTNASKTNPDAAFGVSSTTAYDLGLRGALVDLSSFHGFNDVIKDYIPGSYTNMIVGDAVYGLPETQDFNVIFYRSDMINTSDSAVIKSEVPGTYDELIGLLPAMQRMGMNFTMPIAGGSGLKGISVTAPFIYQYGGDIYSDDYLSTAIDSAEAIEAMNMMVELFTLYSLPLTAQNFYNSFRNGTLPMGQAGFDTYLQILYAAPEIQGKWNIALPLGVEQVDENGNTYINRTNCIATKAVTIFEQSDKKAEAWKFIEWWLSAEVQTLYANGIVATYGETFMWNTANVEAFKTLPIKKEHIEVILESWKSVYNVPQTPATYMIERGVSNAWNAAVFENVSVRAAISDAVIEIDKEITRKMKEFGYIDDHGVIIKEYYIPSLEEMEKWREE